VSFRPLQRRQILLTVLICAAARANAQRPPAISASFVKVQGAGVTVSGYLAKPVAGSGLPAVLLVPEGSELKGAVLENVRDIAAHGFVALAVDYDPEHVSAESELVQGVADEQLSSRLTAGADWLARQRPLVDPQRVSAIGWSGGSARVVKLAQQGQVHAGVLIENQTCRIPENLPAKPAARMLLVLGGCTPQRGQELKASAGVGAYQIRTFEGLVEGVPVWSEIYKFLNEAAAPAATGGATPSASSISVVTIRDIMRVINSDDGVKGKLARLLAGLSGTEIQWDQARSHAAILVESCDWLAGLVPPKGSLAGWRGHVADYRAATERLLKAVEQHYLPAAQQALGRLPQSCGACHADHR
jgi:dienelactone hydrolase